MTTTDRLSGEGISMPDSWDPEIYRQRAEQWRKKADALGEGRERLECLTIADGYARLADLIESRQSQGPAPKPPEN
jgi:hypothetical protein